MYIYINQSNYTVLPIKVRIHPHDKENYAPRQYSPIEIAHESCQFKDIYSTTYRSFDRKNPVVWVCRR